MDNLEIHFNGGDSIFYRYGQLELRDKRNFGYCPYDQIGEYYLMYWEKSHEKMIMVIGNKNLPCSKKYILPSDSEYRESFQQLYQVMRIEARCYLLDTLPKAMRYKLTTKIPTSSSVVADENVSTKPQNVARCPKCRSTSLVANKKGYGVGKAVAGTALFGILPGVFIGGIGRNKIEVTCLRCGKKFKI